MELYEAFSVENGVYKHKDLIICSTNDLCEEWTDLLSPKQPFAGEKQIQKYHIKACTRDLSNGDIIVDTTAPACDHEIAHAFTAHSTIGDSSRQSLH